MNRTLDIMRVLVAMDTFTTQDIGDAFEMPKSTVSKLCALLEKRGYIQTVKVGRKDLMAVTVKAVKAVERAGDIDLEERVLLLETCKHEEITVRVWISSGDIVNTVKECANCEEIVYKSWRQNWFSGWVGASPEEHIVIDLLGS